MEFICCPPLICLSFSLFLSLHLSDVVMRTTMEKEGRPTTLALSSTTPTPKTERVSEVNRSQHFKSIHGFILEYLDVLVTSLHTQILYLSICLFVCLSLSLCLSIRPSIHPFIHSFIHPSIHPSVHPSFCLSLSTLSRYVLPCLSDGTRDGMLCKHHCRHL